MCPHDMSTGICRLVKDSRHASELVAPFMHHVDARGAARQGEGMLLYEKSGKKEDWDVYFHTIHMCS